jgi:putative ABC transport system permease protein
MAMYFENLAIGEKLIINQDKFEVVGCFDADGSSAESEVWTDARQRFSA